MRRPRPTLAAIALGAALVVVAGCSPGDTAGTGAGSSASTSPSLSALPAQNPPPPAEGSGQSDELGPPTVPDDQHVPDDQLAPDQRPLPTTAADLATAIDEAEQALRAGEPAAPPQNVAAWGRRQQLLYRVLAANPEWADTVLAGVDATVRDAAGANWHARTEALELVDTSDLSPTLPAWRIVPPPPADELLTYYEQAEATTGVPWTILASIHLVETRMGRIDGVSSAGAVGPMQFLPSTWEQCCQGDPTNPRDAIAGAADYLTDRGAPTDMDQALLGYNTSEHYVEVVNAYASVLDTDPVTYHAYHAWEVFFLSSAGLAHLPEGYDQDEPVDAATWLQDHPEAHIPPNP